MREGIVSQMSVNVRAGPKPPYSKSKTQSPVVTRGLRDVLSDRFFEFLPALIPQLLQGLHHLWQIGKILALPLNLRP